MPQQLKSGRPALKIPDSLLGKYTDREIARRLGCHYTTVYSHRKRSGFPSARSRRPQRAPAERRLRGRPRVEIEWDKVDWTKSDAAISRSLHVCVATVRNYRISLGKSSLRKRTVAAVRKTGKRPSDTSLSWAAKGVFVFLATKPADALVPITEIAKRGGNCYRYARKLADELAAAGLVTVEQRELAPARQEAQP